MAPGGEQPLETDVGLRRTVTWLAGAVAAATTMLIPALYFYTAFSYETARLQRAADLAADTLSERFYLRPELWRFEVDKHSDLALQVERSPTPISYRILDAEGELIVSFGEELAFPIWTRSAEIGDGLRRAGWLSVSESARPVWYRTLYAAGVGFALGLAVFVSLRVLPLRALAAAQKDLQVLNLELEQRVEARTGELRAAQSELIRNERLAALGQLTGTVSHELRNPLGALRTSLAAIKKLVAGVDFPLLDSSVDIADRSVTRCDNIISDLLDYTRVPKLELEITSIDDWLGRLLDEYEVPPGITLDRDLAFDLEIDIDSDRLRRAVVNLLDNACQAMTDGPRLEIENWTDEKERILTVATGSADGRLQLSVSDTGAGMSVENSAKIFEPLYSTKSFGIGLGLSIVKRTLEQHGGGIDVFSAPGEGARFVLWLPLKIAKESAVS